MKMKKCSGRAGQFPSFAGGGGFCFGHFNFGYLDLFRISWFVLRIFLPFLVFFSSCFFLIRHYRYPEGQRVRLPNGMTGDELTHDTKP
ncbi:MAG TPA: hypothetical protein VK469_15240, partial [Candidatus Kapabacteria bacterium]|nr:hypothetical protein [Candidatus Kapabacteria bacterium]